MISDSSKMTVKPILNELQWWRLPTLLPWSVLIRTCSCISLYFQQTLILLRLFRIWQKSPPKLGLLFSLGPWCSDLWQLFRGHHCMPEEGAAAKSRELEEKLQVLPTTQAVSCSQNHSSKSKGWRRESHEEGPGMHPSVMGPCYSGQRVCVVWMPKRSWLRE